jgi:YaiO family outer membrane protein
MNAKPQLLAALVWLAAAAHAEGDAPAPTPATAPAQPPHTRIEGYASVQHLSAGFSDWRDVGVRVTHVEGPHVLLGELAQMRHFDESGSFASLGDVYTIDPDWYAQLSVGAGNGASYLPRIRLDGFINRKLLPARNLVATLGLAYYHAPDGHTDRSLGLGMIYYFPVPLVVQAEVRRNVSNPGTIGTRRQFIALMWGRPGELQATARHGWGREGYQALGDSRSLVDFGSRETSLGLRRQFGAWGVALQAEYYRNPLYVRRGLLLSVFREFP